MAARAMVLAARRLIRASRAGVLATSAGGQPPGGQPFASLVTPAAAHDLSPLLLLSRLARHTQNLLAEPRCSLLLIGPAADANPQTAPRVTLLATAARLDDPAARARWLALHPYATPYAGFADFSLWRLAVAEAHFVGGFAAAATIPLNRLQPDPEIAAHFAAAEAELLAHANAEHAAALDVIAAAAGGRGAGFRLIAIDTDGCDLASGEQVVRIDFATQADDPAAAAAALVRLAAATNASTPG